MQIAYMNIVWPLFRHQSSAVFTMLRNPEAMLRVLALLCLATNEVQAAQARKQYCPSLRWVCVCVFLFLCLCLCVSVRLCVFLCVCVCLSVFAGSLFRLVWRETRRQVTSSHSFAGFPYLGTTCPKRCPIVIWRDIGDLPSLPAPPPGKGKTWTGVWAAVCWSFQLVGLLTRKLTVSNQHGL